MTNFPLTGGCNCGAVRFEVTSPLLVAASYCRCKRCQRRSGAAASANAHPAPETSGSSPARTSSVCGSRRAVARSGSVATAAPRYSAATRTTPIRSASAWAPSITIPGSARAFASSSPTPRRGSQSPTTDCPTTPRVAMRSTDPRRRRGSRRRRHLISLPDEPSNPATGRPGPRGQQEGRSAPTPGWSARTCRWR
jgi:hypothetical protein